MTFNGPPRPSEARETSRIETPEYWQENPQFKSPRKYFELQFSFAKLMAERSEISLTKAIDMYAPVIRKAIHVLGEDGKELELQEGITEENMLERAWEISLDRREILNTPMPYHSEKDLRFGCSSYDYEKDTKTVRIHFLNAESEEEWVDGKDVSKSPLSEEKLDRRRSELTQMFRYIKEHHPDAQYVRGSSNLYNLKSYRRLYPETYAVGNIDYQQKRWRQGMSIWGQFLGGKSKQPGEYGFKQDLAEQFLEKAKDVPMDRLADALPMPPRVANGPIQDFYDLYGIT